MPSTIAVAAGGFRFAPGVYQYSPGVAAEPGFRIERARFAEPVPLAEGFARIAAALDAAGRPRAAFCACELRSPEPFTEEDRKSTRLNSSHANISYAVFCLKK